MVVVTGGGGAVVVGGGDVVLGVGAGPGFGAVVVVTGEVAAGPVVDGDVVSSVKRIRSPLTSRPFRFGGDGKSLLSIPLVAAAMNRLKIAAGNEPPFTLRPCTATMARDCPSG